VRCPACAPLRAPIISLNRPGLTTVCLCLCRTVLVTRVSTLTTVLRIIPVKGDHILSLCGLSLFQVRATSMNLHSILHPAQIRASYSGLLYAVYVFHSPCFFVFSQFGRCLVPLLLSSQKTTTGGEERENASHTNIRERRLVRIITTYYSISSAPFSLEPLRENSRGVWCNRGLEIIHYR